MFIFNNVVKSLRNDTYTKPVSYVCVCVCVCVSVCVCVCVCVYIYIYTYIYIYIHTHTHTHTFCELWGLSIGVMVFILYKPYFLSPYTNPTPKPTSYRKKLILCDL